MSAIIQATRPRRTWHDAVAARPWSPEERRVVMRGFWGRLTIAIEPMLAGVFFLALPIGLLLRKQVIGHVVAPIFVCAALLFAAYAIYLMVSPVWALIETFSPIYIVDGYVRYRSAERDGVPTHYIAVLDSDRAVLGEWPLHEWPRTIGNRLLWPVLVEFSEYGGIHKIDGRATGVLPVEIASLGVGIAADDARRNSRR